MRKLIEKIRAAILGPAGASVPNSVITTFVEDTDRQVQAKYLELRWKDYWIWLGCSDVEADRAARVCMRRAPSAADQMRAASRAFQYAATSMQKSADQSRRDLERMFADGGLVREPLRDGEYIIPAGARMAGLGVGAGLAVQAAAVEDAKWCDDQRFRLAGLTGVPMSDITLEPDQTSRERRWIARRGWDGTVLAYLGR
jgi:hypothetical protein